MESASGKVNLANMAQKTIETKEVLKNKFKGKQVFHCVGDGFDVLSREVLKNGNEIHYPFDTRNGSQKYKYISMKFKVSYQVGKNYKNHSHYYITQNIT